MPRFQETTPITPSRQDERPYAIPLVIDAPHAASWYPEGDFYNDLGTHRVIPIVAVYTGVRMVVGVVGIALNSQLISITTCNKDLHGRCNILIALNALACAVHEMSFVITFVITATGVNLIPLIDCHWFMVASAFAKYCSLCLLIVIAIDRLKAAVFVHGWHPTGEAVYTAFGLSMCAAYGLCVVVVCYRSAHIYTETKVMCSLSETFVDDADGITYTSALILNCVSLGCYCLLGIVIKRSKKSSANNPTTKLFKSLCLIMIFEFFGWGSDSIFQVLQDQFWTARGMSAFTKWQISTVLSYLLAIATAANGPVLFFCSSNYRKAYAAHLSYFRCRSMIFHRVKRVDVDSVHPLAASTIHPANGMSETPLAS